MTAAFYQDAWDIIKTDIQKMVVAFFCGHTLPRFITHTNLGLLPKKISGKFFFRFETYFTE